MCELSHLRIVFCSRQKVMKGEHAQEFRHPQKKKNKKKWIQGALSCCAEKPGGQVQNRQEEEAPERICCCRVFRCCRLDADKLPGFDNFVLCFSSTILDPRGETKPRRMF